MGQENAQLSEVAGAETPASSAPLIATSIGPDQMQAAIELIRDPGKHGMGTMDGFKVFYILCTGRALPPTGHRMIEGIYEALDQGLKDVAIEAFRGSTKSTTVNVWLAYQLGLRPDKEVMVIRVQDPAASEATSFISLIIQHNPVFKAAFPYVEPDPARGWGEKGYWVKRTDMDYAEWVRLTGDTPSLLGAGYKSGIIIGKHPRGVLIIDDIHNSQNTRSVRELNAVKEIYAKDIRNIRTPDTVQVMVFTPWVPDDLYDTWKRGEKVKHVFIPATIGGRWPGEPTWPEEYPLERLEEIEKDPTVGPIAFAQMYLCNLEAKKGQVLPGEYLGGFPAHEIDPTWRTVMGVDYASIQSEQDKRGRDFFNLCIAKIHPVSGALIVFDGVHDKLSQVEAEQTAISMIEKYNRTFFRMGVEQIGKGEEFYNLMVRKYARGIMGYGVGNKPKGYRYERQLAPAAFDGRIMIAEDTGVKPRVPVNWNYVEELVNEWLMWDGSETYPDDALDALYMCTRAAAGFVRMGPGKNADYVEVDEMCPRCGYVGAWKTYKGRDYCPKCYYSISALSKRHPYLALMEAKRHG